MGFAPSWLKYPLLLYLAVVRSILFFYAEIEDILVSNVSRIDQQDIVIFASDDVNRYLPMWTRPVEVEEVIVIIIIIIIYYYFHIF